MKRYSIALFWMIALSTQVQCAPQAPTEKAAVGFINDLISSVIATCKENVPAGDVSIPPSNLQKLREEFTRLLANNVSIEEAAGWVVGPRLRQFSPEQKAKFYDLFKRNLVELYLGKVKMFRSATPKISEEVTRNGDGSVTVKGDFTVEQAGHTSPPVKIVFVVRFKENAPKIFNVLIEGISQQKAQRDDFSALFDGEAKGSTEKFLDLLEERIKHREASAG